MKIINGENASSGDFDFMTALFMQGRFFCGGVLLDNTTVLTGAHCSPLHMEWHHCRLLRA